MTEPVVSKSALRVAGTMAVLFALSHLADAWVYHHVRDPQIYDRDWGRMLRLVGYLPVWMIVAVVLALRDRSHPEGVGAGWLRRGARLLAAPVVAGLVAEVAKILVRRERPSLTDGLYVFRAWSDRFFATKDLGFPSSHAAVAFGAAAMLARLCPWGTLLWYGLAVACAATRVLSQAHFLSDVIAGALAGYLTAVLLWSCLERNRPHGSPSP